MLVQIFHEDAAYHWRQRRPRNDVFRWPDEARILAWIPKGTDSISSRHCRLMSCPGLRLGSVSELPLLLVSSSSV